MRNGPFALIAAFALSSCSQGRGMVEEMVAVAPAQLYAQMDTQVAALEQAVAAKPTKTGTPPVPVKFSFVRDPDRLLRIKAAAGFRTVTLELFFEEGDSPAHTRLSANAFGMSDADGIAPGNVRVPVLTRLTEAVSQANDGVRISALFGRGVSSGG